MITLSTPHPRQRGPLLAPVVVDRVAWRDTPCKGTGNAKCDAAQYELSRHSYHEGMIHSRSGTMRQHVASARELAGVCSNPETRTASLTEI